jgi:hypothetical protein
MPTATIQSAQVSTMPTIQSPTGVKTRTDSQIGQPSERPAEYMSEQAIDNPAN